MDIGSGFNIDWQEWNILGLQWQENSIKWVLNGKVNGTLDTTGEEELNSKMFPIFNLAVGGNMGGEVDISDWSDAYLEFAYIRWYQKGATQSCNIN
jgi:beta-glucanase (GH16 family)